MTLVTKRGVRGCEQLGSWPRPNLASGYSGRLCTVYEAYYKCNVIVKAP